MHQLLQNAPTHKETSSPLGVIPLAGAFQSPPWRAGCHGDQEPSTPSHACHQSVAGNRPR